MKTLLITTILGICAVLVNAQKVQVGADRTVDLRTYKTYMWTPGQLTANPIVGQTIIDAVDRAMAAKGLKRVDADADMTVVIFTAIEHDMHIAYPSWHPGLNSITTGVAVGSQSWPITKGTLVVAISDSKTKNDLWRGTATDTLNHGPTGDMAKDAKSVEKVVRKAVEKMFKQYPYPPEK
jgi:hypothetical protein